MTQKQLHVLRCLADAISRRGYAPTIRELCDQHGWSSPAAAQQHLSCLERDGLITRERGKARTIQITDKGREQLVEVAA